MSERLFELALLQQAHEVCDLVISKQKDYGKKNILNSIIDPRLAVLVRLQDKLARAANLIQNNKDPLNESLKDTAQDIVGYGLILEMLIDGEFELPMEQKDELAV